VKDTVSVFWVDLGYRLRSRKRVPLQGSQGMTGISSDTLLFTLTKYEAIWPGSVPETKVVVPGTYGTHLKHREYLH